MNYKVMNLQDNIYQVFKYLEDAAFEEWGNVFQGSLADCEAYIRLDQAGYL